MDDHFRSDADIVRAVVEIPGVNGAFRCCARPRVELVERRSIDMFERYGADMTAEEFAQGVADTIDKLEAAFGVGQEVAMHFGYK